AKLLEMSREELLDLAIRREMELDSLKRQIYGQRSERHVPAEIINQMKLELGQIGESQAPPEMEAISYERKKAKKKKPHPGLYPLPTDLPRKEILIEPEEDTSGMKQIGEEVTEALDFIPAKFLVNRYIRPKYARTDYDPDGGEAGVVCAPMPARPIDKGIAEAGLLAIILLDKYLDHLPLYRQIQRFKRAGVNIPDSTIADWIAQTCRLLDPLFAVHRRQVLTQHYLQVDETTIKVLDRQKNKQKKNVHLGYFWVYHSPLQRLVLFDYQPSRRKEEPVKCLKNYQGYLQTDGYAAYNQFGDKKGIVMLGCMAHARRKFFEAGESDPRVAHALGVFQKLYAIEATAREHQLTHDQRQKIREKESKPIWEQFKQWLLGTWKELTPKHKLNTAIEYMLPRWTQLGRYLLNGELEIDNNLIENQIRPVALGRKNYLFAGSHNGARRSAMIYSLLGTCKLHGIEPYAWLKDILQRLPEHPVNRVEELLPHNWMREQS
ncbi:MAG: IS66 family transposase, partial [Bacteroidota bacterium]